MKLFRVKNHHRVRRWISKHDLSGHQKLERVKTFLGVEIYLEVIDQENVPSWATIEFACLGSSSWKSRLFKEYAQLLGVNP